MKRDMDLIRELLLMIDEEPQLDGNRWMQFESAEQMGIKGHSTEEVGYHLNMLIEAGFIKGDTAPQVMPLVSKLTWAGHEFLDDIRDNTIWGKTKERAKSVGGAGLAVIAELAKAEIKKHLGLA